MASTEVFFGRGFFIIGASGQQKKSMPEKIKRRVSRFIQHIMLSHFLIISIGAILGANARYLVSGWAGERFGATFPYGNLIINLTGSFLLGLFMTLATERFIVDPRWRILISIGFLGSFTTFSSYTYESLTLLLSGQWKLGLLNLFGSSAMGGIAVTIGVLLGRVL